MSGLFGSTTIKGTRITDFAKTSADVGSTIPFLYGRAPVTGNVIFAALPPKENRQVKRQGKGGVKQESFPYTTSYAIAFCRGPIQGYWWIKRNGKVVYSQDPAAPVEDKDYAAKWAAKVMMYNGTSGQLPNSMIESYMGSGRVSAFKYLAYIAVPNEDVTEGGGAIPSCEAVPIASPAEVWITSTPYAQIFYSKAEAAFAPTGGELVQLLYDADMQSDEVAVSFGPTGGDLFEVPPPRFDDEATVAFGPTGGELKIPPPQYFYDAATAGFGPIGGNLAVPPTGTMQKDEVTVGFGPTGGTLSGGGGGGGAVVSLLHFDGADGSTTFTDEKGRTWTAFGNAQIDTAQSQFGGASLLLDGSGDYLSAADSDDFNFAAGDFTVEGWFREAVSGAIRQLIGQHTTQAMSNSSFLVLSDNSVLKFSVFVGGTNYAVIPAGTHALNTWHHFAAVRDGGTLRLFLNGTSVGTASISGAANNSNRPVYVGVVGSNSGPDGGNYYFNGHIDELRITKGVARYTADFTPPSAPFPNS